MKPSPPQLRVLARRDPMLGAVLRRFPPFPGFPEGVARRPRTHFEELARAIVHQQLAGAAARTIWGRVRALRDGSGAVGPETIARLSDEALRGAGLSRGKLAALRDLSARAADGRLRLRSIGRRSDEEVIEHLVQVFGIGVWTAQMFLLFRLGRLDVIAPGDLGLQEGLRLLDGLDQRPTPAELERRAEVWRPLRSVAAWALWRLVDEG
ncbi:MAG TPA: DNA-3-methyladenine glycosylase 2 family protein [Planctomycetota bacterium]|nr:DNA-3-methyladenine glycosylase 2 family protein [Planctomycetota bacterium]